VEFDVTRPSVTVNQASPPQTDPTHIAPVNFTVQFSEDVSGFTSFDVSIGGTAGGTKTAVVTGGPATYNVAVSGMSSSGTVVVSVPSGRVQDAAGNTNTASTSTDNSIACISAGSRIGDAKMLADGAGAAFIEKAVTAVFGDHFYVEENDCSAGLRVKPANMPQGLAIGSRVDVLGSIKTETNGERFVDGAASLQSGISPVRPVALSQHALGGADWLYGPEDGAGQRGVLYGVGLNNIGLLVKTWGRVVSHEPVTPPTQPGWFIIYDGSSYMKMPEGIVIPVQSKVICPPGVPPPAVGSFVCITGISTCERSGSDLLRVLRVRSQADMQIL